MSVSEKYLGYRGEIRAIAGSRPILVFVTEHPEGRPTALYRLDCRSFELASDPLPHGGRSLCVADDRVWIGGTDGTLSLGSISGGPPSQALTIEGGAPIPALASLADGRLAIASGPRVIVAAISKGKAAPLQELELPSEATCLASDPTGRWLVAGSAKGDVSVFSAEGRDDFILSESSRLHEGAVTVLAFEPDDLRFLSAGADRSLRSTLARGSLEPEDRAKRFGHDDVITAISWAPGDRFLTGSLDSTIKTWPRTGGARPATLKDGIARVRGLAVVTVHDRPRLVVCCEDNTLRLVVLDAAGKFGDVSHRLYDALSRARHDLAEGDPRRREAALADLASAGDASAIDLLAQHSRADGDPGLRLDAARKVGEADHPRAVPLLEGLLDHPDEAVRALAFDRLRHRAGPDDLRPIDLALKAGAPEIGRLAVEALGPIARKDDQAYDRLLAALDAREWEVRRSAAEVLESTGTPDSPEATLTALGAKHADLRRWGLLRLWHRDLLGRPTVATALRRRLDDKDAEVRRVAFLLMLHTRPRLRSTLRAKDPDLDRQFADLDADPSGQGGAAGPPDSKKAETGGAKPRAKPKPSKKGGKAKAEAEAPDAPGAGLDPDDLSPLLAASSSRSLDTSLRGARGLAMLGDPRAFGLLLQLSREAEPSARVEVCRALAELRDPAAVDRLRSLLFDPAPEVRDAAFTALAAINADAPLQAAAAGLDADQDDVRRRGLQLLLAEAKKAPPESADDPIGRLLVRALNDGSAAIRAEAFKAALNLPAAGGRAGALRFARRSIHADVRREVLTEVLGQAAEPWAWDLLLEAFDDPDPALRLDAFTAAEKKTRGLEVLDAALGCRHADLRAKAVAGLVKKHSASAQKLLLRAIDDEDRDVRRLAIDALVTDDARDALALALSGPHADVRVRAASALARLGDRAALGPLVALAASPEPPEAERRADWLALAAAALDGLAELGDPEAVVPALPLLDSPHAPLRQGASAVLCWCSTPEEDGPLRQALSHADPSVTYRAAMGLALRGDASIAPLLDSPEGAKLLSRADRLAVAAALGDLGDPRLVVSLDDDDETTRALALLLLVFRELKTPRGDASRLVAALSSRAPRVRLLAADTLRSALDPTALLDAATRLVNDRGDQPSWSVPGPTVDAMAALLTLSPPLVRARAAALLLPTISPEHTESAALELALARLSRRFPQATEAPRAPASTAAPIPAKELEGRAFGAYVGLVREQGERAGSKAKKKRKTPSPAVKLVSPEASARVRRSAADRLRALADADPALSPSVIPVLVQALGDPSQDVRLAAFDHLLALGLEPTTLGAEALGAGHSDVGVRGLELLGASPGDAEAGRSALEQVMMSRKDDLAVEAARLLSARVGRLAVSSKALEAGSDRLRTIAVSWLAEEAVEGKGGEPARAALRGALDSRYAAVRRAAALALADKKDAAAFDALVRLLAEAVEKPEQARIVAAFEALGDPRAAGALLDRLEEDPAGTSPAELLIPASSRFRRPEDAGRLLSLMDRQKNRRALAFDAVLTISGHDQPIDDPFDDRPGDRSWMAKQHPRRDALLAELIDRCLSLAEPRLLQRAIAPARWALGPEVDEPLSRAATHPDEGPRHLALQAIGWRLRRRSGPAEPLLKAIAHPDPTSQFLAAEGLALGKRAEGLAVLRSAVDFLQDLSLRRRAVVALGELGDPRAFDLLVQLAGEDGHALQDVAAEALGHLGRSGKADEVFSLLDRRSRSPGSVSPMALKGLRWLGTPEAWARIRAVADGVEDLGNRRVALELLAFDDEPATRDLLLRHLREGEFPDCGIALRSARLVFGPESIEPDEAAVQNPSGLFGPSPRRWAAIQSQCDIPLDSPLDRLRARGEPGRLFALIPRCPDETADAIGAILLDRPEPPLDEARAALGSDHPLAVSAASRLLGRARDAASSEAIATALGRWLDDWSRRREAIARDSRGWHLFMTGNVHADGVPRALASLAWAAGRLGIAAEAIGDLVALGLVAHAIPDEQKLLRASAEALLLFDSPPAAALDALERLSRDGPPDLRGPAADALARVDAERASRLAPELLGDPVGLDRLADRAGAALDGLLDASAPRLHEQGVVVPLLVDRQRIDALARVADDRSLPDSPRLGAIEGLSALAAESAEEHLRRVGLDDRNDEQLRKAAWRALRRSKRARGRPHSRRRPEVTP
ncbi:HEAT repeat domain-containing protein [Tautonia sociabilis]|uniref:Uncharacterized protein n=1 Tax=Tautonia sociabilis TaxID=2080755 RepID=A0A432MI75_9BACT|nr:HEAT repeat domain-containing protein [Tautonia sociabilis]RUL87063.1 hypothetical protein TsocGM_14070 [Tautonia sociabilis]